MATPKIFKYFFLICMKLYHHAKTQLIPLAHSWDTVSLWAQGPDWPYAFLTMPNQKMFNQLLIFVNFILLAKNEAVSSIFYGEIFHLKILQSDWLRGFWPISQEQDLFQIKDLSMNIANNKNFQKLMTKFFFKFTKNLIFDLFLAHFPNFGVKVFPKNRAVMHNFIRISGTMPKFREM